MKTYRALDRNLRGVLQSLVPLGVFNSNFDPLGAISSPSLFFLSAFDSCGIAGFQAERELTNCERRGSRDDLADLSN